MQPQLIEGDSDHVTHSSGGETTTIVVSGQPIAQAARLSCPAHDLIERNAADHTAGVIEDDVRERRSQFVRLEHGTDDNVLAINREVVVTSNGLPWGEEIAIDAEQFG